MRLALQPLYDGAPNRKRATPDSLVRYQTRPLCVTESRRVNRKTERLADRSGSATGGKLPCACRARVVAICPHARTPRPHARVRHPRMRIRSRVICDGVRRAQRGA